MALCSADITLEPGDFMMDAPDFWSSQSRYICADTKVMYEWMDNNFDAWLAYPNVTR